ncbi:MAG: 4-(cytidine 5'-diphospho)-2-C-methyl-D-erythritol kinase [Hyphomicrobiaceae bacterium]
MITELARAKVNLTLEILGRREDGFHELASLVAFADIGDRLTLETGPTQDIKVSGPFAPSIAGENLIAVTLRRLAEFEPRLRLGSVTLDKQLPVAAGIGGGSADAAALLRAVRRANPELGLSLNWSRIATGLGADVPVCLANRTAWMTGIGERVTPLVGWPTLGAVLVNPLVPAPVDKTAQVFRRLAAKALVAGVRCEPPSSGERAIDFLGARGNMLEPAAIAVMPIAAAVKAALLGTPGCRHAAVSGGGPTCFGIFDYPVEAAARLAAEEPTWWVRPVTLGD